MPYHSKTNLSTICSNPLMHKPKRVCGSGLQNHGSIIQKTFQVYEATYNPLPLNYY